MGVRASRNVEVEPVGCSMRTRRIDNYKPFFNDEKIKLAGFHNNGQRSYISDYATEGTQ